MTLIAGAAQFLGAATLAIKQGRAAVSPTMLGESGLGDILDIGRRNVDNGIGLSPRSRLMNKKFLERTQGLGNTLLSIGAEANSVEGLQKQILALRGKFRNDQLAPSLRGNAVDKKA